MMTPPFAVVMAVMVDAETNVHRADVGADDVGSCRRPAEQGQGEYRGDQQFHG